MIYFGDCIEVKGVGFMEEVCCDFYLVCLGLKIFIIFFRNKTVRLGFFWDGVVFRKEKDVFGEYRVIF